MKLKSEQVSHHPPILAEYYENRELGIINMGHFGLKANFSGTVVKARVEASNWTRVIKYDEDYVFTSPTFVIRGFLVANPFFDMVGEATVHCPTTGYKAILEFRDKVRLPPFDSVTPFAPPHFSAQFPPILLLALVPWRVSYDDGPDIPRRQS